MAQVAGLDSSVSALTPPVPAPRPAAAAALATAAGGLLGTVASQNASSGAPKRPKTRKSTRQPKLMSSSGDSTSPAKLPAAARWEACGGGCGLGSPATRWHTVAAETPAPRGAAASPHPGVSGGGEGGGLCTQPPAAEAHRQRMPESSVPAPQKKRRTCVEAREAEPQGAGLGRGRDVVGHQVVHGRQRHALAQALPAPRKRTPAC